MSLSLRRIAIPAVLLALISSAFAQDQTPDQQEQLPTFKSGVEIVNIFFTVRKNKALVANLKKEDFEVKEDGQPQKIKFFSAETNLPLTMGIMIDTSGSMAAVLPDEQELGSQFVRQTMTPKDLAFLINFDVNVELAQDLTSQPKEIANELNKTKINVGGASGGIPGIGQGPVPIHRPRGTALFDAVYLASTDKMASEVGRKALIILTDGEDQGSKSTLDDAIEAAQKADAMCYVILVYDPRYGSNSHDMGKLADETGGRVIEVGSNSSKMREAFDRISEELRSQYSIGYTPTDSAKDGKFHRVEIKTPAGKVQARSGYFALK